MSDEPDKKDKKNTIMKCFFYGIFFFFLAELLLHEYTELHWLGIGVLSIAKEMGFAFIIAAIVSWLFDIGYLKDTFIRPIRELLEKIGDFNQLVGYAQRHGISAIFGRKQGDSAESQFWKETIKKTIIEADEYLFIMARSLDTLIPFPTTNKDDGIISNIRKSLLEKPNLKIIIILANTYNEKSGFRQECEIRAKEEGLAESSYFYLQSRATANLFLGLAQESNNLDRISVKLTDISPPFAMFMTEKRAVIEPYLPFIEGVESIVFTVERYNISKEDKNSEKSKNHIYESYVRCYKHILDIAKTKNVFEAIKNYQNSNLEDPRKIEKTKSTLEHAEKMSAHDSLFNDSISKFFESS